MKLTTPLALSQILFRLGRVHPGLVLGLMLLVGCGEKSWVAPVASTPASSPAVILKVMPSLGDRKKAGDLRYEGLRQRQQGQMDAAILTMQKATSLDPTNLSGWVLLGWTQHLAGQSTAAIASLQSALKLDPNHVPALNALGIVYLVAGDLPKAITTHQKALALHSENEIAHYNLALAYERQQQFEQAISHAQAAAKLEPSNPHPFVALAIAFWGKGNKTQAMQAYRQAISLDGRYRDRQFLSDLKAAGFSADQITRSAEILTATRSE